MSVAESDDVEFENETIEIAPYIFEITTIAYLPIEILMQNQSKGVEISGQKIWCGSLTVADYILANPHLVKDRVVVELGAGTGVLGMVCSRLGCAMLLLTDNDPRSISHMKSDCKSNAVEAIVCNLDWFSPDVSFLNSGDISFTHELCVVAGDVLYKRILLEPFFMTSCSLLRTRNQSCMYLCHVPRAGVGHSDVVDEAKKQGLLIEEIQSRTGQNDNARKYCPDEDTDRAKLYRMQLKT